MLPGRRVAADLHGDGLCGGLWEAAKDNADMALCMQDYCVTMNMPETHPSRTGARDTY